MVDLTLGYIANVEVEVEIEQIYEYMKQLEKDYMLQHLIQEKWKLDVDIVDELINMCVELIDKLRKDKILNLKIDGYRNRKS